MNAPGAILTAVRDASAALGAGAVDYPQAVIRVREAIEGDPAYARGILRAHAGRLLAEHRKTNPETPDPLQAELFPGLPARLYVSPGRPELVMDLTRYGLEMARNMLYARTTNQAEGAARSAAQERAEFDRLYEAVMPRMTTGEITVADALAAGRGTAQAV